MPFIQIFRSIHVRVFRFLHKREFADFGGSVFVFEGAEFMNKRLIAIESDVVIQRHCYIAASDDGARTGDVRISIGDGSNIGPRNHIFAAQSVRIGRKVISGPNVFISDCTHEYSDVRIPVIDQEVRVVNNTSVGDDSWLGINSIIMGCSVGRHCIIGANSVVLSDIPDYCVAVGNPARIVRHYDRQSQSWILGAPVSRSSDQAS